MKRITRGGTISWRDPGRKYAHWEGTPAEIDLAGTSMWFQFGGLSRPDKRMRPTLFSNGLRSDLGGLLPEAQNDLPIPRGEA
jgi:hypothetical protein